MPWPPSGVPLPVNRTDALYQQGNHPDDHNKENQAINDIVAKIDVAAQLLVNDGGVSRFTDKLQIQYSIGYTPTSDAAGVFIITFMEAFAHTPYVALVSTDTPAGVYGRMYTNMSTAFDRSTWKITDTSGAPIANFTFGVNALVIGVRP